VDAKTGPVRLTPLIQRVIWSAATLALGVVVGTFASLYHGVLFPWGLAAALALVTLAVAGVRTLFVERYTIVWTSVGILGAQMLLAGVDGNASVLILADTQGLVLLGGTTLLVVGAIAWPRFPPRTTRYDREVESSERTHQP
jgi:glucan phosphoethanolaminetransferase (alkaline phosphatase superfamily)